MGSQPRLGHKLPAIRLQTVDKLPQPYRLIDKTVALIVEKALEAVHIKQTQERDEDARFVAEVHSPALTSELSLHPLQVQSRRKQRV